MSRKQIEPGTRYQSAQTYYSQNSFPVSFNNNLKNMKQSRRESKQQQSQIDAPLESQQQILGQGITSRADAGGAPLNRQIIEKIYQQQYPQTSVKSKRVETKSNQKFYKTNKEERRKQQSRERDIEIEKEKQKEKERQKQQKSAYFRTKQDIIRSIYNSKMRYKFRNTIKSSMSNKHIFQQQQQLKQEPAKQLYKPKLAKITKKKSESVVEKSPKVNKTLTSKTTRDKFQLSNKNRRVNRKEYPRVDLSQVLNSMPGFDKKPKEKQESELNFPKLFQRQKYHESQQQSEEETNQNKTIKNPKRQFRNIVQQSLDEGEEGVTKLINTFEPHTASYSQTDKSEFKIKKYKNGVYFGQLSQQAQLKEGIGIVFYFNGKLYEGQLKNDMKQGKGYELYVDSSYYQGQYVKGYKQGKGRFYWSNGEIYDGEWHRGRKHGSGMWKASPNSKKSYIGEWWNGKPHGFGVFFNHVGDRYEGEFRYGLKNGHGTERYINGDLYVGQFVKGRKTGMGQYRYLNGDIYIGQFCNNLKHGRGKFIQQKTKQIYQGSYRNDNISGIGQYLFEDGTIYEVIFRHGQGIVTYRDDSFVEGYWINGVKIGITSRGENQRYSTIEHEAVKQFANIKEQRKKRLSLRQVFREEKQEQQHQAKSNTKSDNKSKSLVRNKLSTKREFYIQKADNKKFNRTIDHHHQGHGHESRCQCYGHRRMNY